MATLKVGNFELSTVETLSVRNNLEWRSCVFVRRTGEGQLLEILNEVGHGDTWLQAREAALVIGKEFAESLDPDESVESRQRRRGW